MSELVSDVAFTPSVKAMQDRMGSRDGYAKMASKRDWASTITDDLGEFIATRDSFYFATASGDGRPYIQHRGGPAGFLKVLDTQTLGFADFSGNRQYISLGNLADNDRVHLFLMDYPGRQRVKIWGRARVVEDDPALLAKLVVPGYDARPERAITITIEAWDANCPQHITPRYDTSMIAAVTQPLRDRIATLEAALAERQTVPDAKTPVTP